MVMVMVEAEAGAAMAAAAGRADRVEVCIMMRAATAGPIRVSPVGTSGLHHST